MTYTELVAGHDFQNLITHVNENFRKRSFMNELTVTADFTVWGGDSAGVPLDFYNCDTAAATTDASLPAANSTDAAASRVVWFRWSAGFSGGAGEVPEIVPAGSDTINGYSDNMKLGVPFECVGLVSDGTSDWEIVSHYKPGKFITSVVFASSPYTVKWYEDQINCNCTGGAITVNLEVLADIQGRELTVSKTDVSGNAATVDGASAETINGAATHVLAAQYDSVSMRATNEWNIYAVM